MSLIDKKYIIFNSGERHIKFIKTAWQVLCRYKWRLMGAMKGPREQWMWHSGDVLLFLAWNLKVLYHWMYCSWIAKRIFPVRNSKKNSLGKGNSVNKDTWYILISRLRCNEITERSMNRSQFPNPKTKCLSPLIFCSPDERLSCVLLSKCNWNRLYCDLKNNATVLRIWIL